MRKSFKARAYVRNENEAPLSDSLLISLQKEKEELDDLNTELELADEDEKIQYGQTTDMSPT